MSLIALIIFVLTTGLIYLILAASWKMIRRSSIQDKKTDLRLVNEEFNEVKESEEEFKGIEEKRNAITNFKKQ